MYQANKQNQARQHNCWGFFVFMDFVDSTIDLKRPLKIEEDRKRQFGRGIPCCLLWAKHLTRSHPFISPFGLLPTASRAASLAAWVSLPFH